MFSWAISPLDIMCSCILWFFSVDKHRSLSMVKDRRISLLLKNPIYIDRILYISNVMLIWHKHNIYEDQRTD